MGILSLEIKFSNFGISSSGKQRAVCYIPVAVVQFEGQLKKKRIYFSTFVSDKKSVIVEYITKA